VFKDPFLLDGISKSNSGILMTACSDLTTSLDKSSNLIIFNYIFNPNSWIAPPDYISLFLKPQ
jgi:hypothetical protein